MVTKVLSEKRDVSVRTCGCGFGGAGDNSTLLALCHRVAGRLGADTCGIAIVEGSLVRYVGGYGFDWENVPAVELGQSLLGQVVANRRVIGSRDMRGDPRCELSTAARRMDIAAFLGCPLEDQQGVIGGVLAAHMRRPFDWLGDQVVLLESMASSIGLFIRPVATPATRRHTPNSSQAEVAARGLVYHSEGSRQVIEFARKVAPNDTAVLICGERGTGKSELARVIHESSGRSGPLVTVSCAELPAELLESEMFGHVRGAFTGAVTSRRGLVLSAEGGTLFLDEIGDLPSHLQPKLLRLIERKEVRQVGEDRVRTVDVRILAATNRDIGPASEFRQDLRDRLASHMITIPPLRERPEDISRLIDRLVMEAAESFQHPVKGVSRRVRAALLKYAWPGNIRELQSVIKGMMLRTPRGHVVSTADIPPATFGERCKSPGTKPSSSRRQHRTRPRVTDQDLRHEHNKNPGNVYRIAKNLGISWPAAQKRLKKLTLLD
ncbi:MAG: sigma 54-interacting transcriptional regulator [Acidobacteria bacterium]|nr:sigma 54-interacting transcriptional regulator [Acidobacteriota bacterium]